MTDKIFQFADQMKVGKKGEQLLLKKWKSPVRKLEGKGPDFIDTEGRLIELKSDTYSMEASENFFLERWSVAPNGDKPGKLGGPWQAAEKGATTFVYLFLNDKTWFIFHDINALITRLNVLTAKAYAINIRNRGYMTQGFKVPRKALEDLYVEEEL